MRYGVAGSSEEDMSMLMVSRDSGGMATIFGLSKETVYTIQVAAVTSSGTGVYTDPLTFETPDSQ